MSECTKDISWSSLITVVTSGGDLGSLLWLNTVTAMIRMTTGMTIPITIITDTVTMVISSTETVKVHNIII